MVSVSIRLKKATRERLKAIGMMGETYDDVINKLLDCWKKETYDDLVNKMPDHRKGGK